MFASINCGTLNGIDGIIVRVEVDIREGLPSFDIVGLPGSAIKEAKERVRTAINNSNLQFPMKKITVNLSPADIKKEGPLFDLPIAIAILTCIHQITQSQTEDYFFVGELSLDGQVRSVDGILPLVDTAKNAGLTNCIVPIDNIQEASLIEGINIYGVSTLLDVINHFNGKPLTPSTYTDIATDIINDLDNLDFAHVKGQELVKRAITIAVSGYHNILMIGPPGSGKTMVAKRIPSIMPPLDFDEKLEVTKLYSVAGKLNSKNSLISTRPFRSPHHTISYSALTGGGSIPRPGEISLAHKGILFLDELPEFHKNVLEVLRQPLEDKEVTISRVQSTITYPSNFMLVASMNPCPCGYYGASDRCTCTNNEVQKYLNKISGPLLDRIDIHVEASSVSFDEFHDNTISESSADLSRKVQRAIAIQQERYKDEKIKFNSELTPNLIEKYCKLGEQETEMLRTTFDALNLSARAYHKILKLSRTIADLDDKQDINFIHIAEAIQYRTLDRKYWGN